MKWSLSTNAKGAQNKPKMLQRSTSLVEPSRVAVNRDATARSNVVIRKRVITVKKAEAKLKMSPAKKLIPMSTQT